MFCDRELFNHEFNLLWVTRAFHQVIRIPRGNINISLYLLVSSLWSTLRSRRNSAPSTTFFPLRPFHSFTCSPPRRKTLSRREPGSKAPSAVKCRLEIWTEIKLRVSPCVGNRGHLSRRPLCCSGGLILSAISKVAMVVIRHNDIRDRRNKSSVNSIRPSMVRYCFCCAVHCQLRVDMLFIGGIDGSTTCLMSLPNC